MNNKDFTICSGSSGDTTINIDYLGAAQPALDTITLDGLDTITLDSSIYTSSSITSPCTITLPSSYTTTGIGCHTSNWTTGTNYTFSGINSITDPAVKITEDGVDIKENGDLKIGGRSLKEFMLKMEQRLAILVPDPEKLEKFEALKKAYEHYKTLESLCFNEPEEEK